MNRNEINAVIIDEVDDIIYIVDVKTYELLFINRKTIDVLKITSEKEWKHQKCYEVLQGRNKPCHDCPQAEILRKGHYEWKKYNEMLGLNIYKKYKLIDFDGRAAKLCVATDVSVIHETIEKLNRQLEIDEVLVSCIKTLYSMSDIESAIDRILSLIADFHKADRAYIFETDKSGKYINNTYEWCKEGIEEQIDFLQNVDISVIDRWRYHFDKKGEFFIKSVEKECGLDTEEYQILEEQGIESLMAAPLNIDGKFFGFLGVDNPRKNTDTLLLISSAAAFVINDIQRKKHVSRLYELSYMDLLTEVGNRHAYVRFMHKIENETGSVGIIFADINGLKRRNDKYGHESGDQMICDVADVLKESFEDNIFRVGGDEFVVFCKDMSEDEFNEKVELLNKSWKKDATASLGCLWLPECSKIEEKVAEADKLMYGNKRDYYCKNGIDRRRSN